MQERLQKTLSRAEASRRPWPRRVEDQPRHAQHPGLRAADVGPAAPGQGPDRAGLRAETAARARPRRLLFRRRACLWPHPGAAAVAPPAAAAPAGRRRPGSARHRAESGIEFVNAVDPAFEVDADSDQLFRVLTNLCRNAVQAMAADTESAVVRRLARVGRAAWAASAASWSPIPALACRQKARENLFAAFRGSARSGGTGLGLAIAHELIARPWRHGGAGRKHWRPHHLCRHHSRPAGAARPGPRRPAPPGLTAMTLCVTPRIFACASPRLMKAPVQQIGVDLMSLPRNRTNVAP